MSVAHIRLECVLERSTDRVAVAVDAILRRQGWRPTDDADGAARTIHLAKANGWVIVDERDQGGLSVSLTQEITSELGCMGISMHAQPDFDAFSVERWLAGKSMGQASFDGESGNRRKPAVVKLGFLMMPKNRRRFEAFTRRRHQGGRRALARAGTLDLGDHLDAVSGAENREHVVGRCNPLRAGLQLIQRDAGLSDCEVLTDAVNDLVEDSAHPTRLSASGDRSEPPPSDASPSEEPPDASETEDYWPPV